MLWIVVFCTPISAQSDTSLVKSETPIKKLPKYKTKFFKKYEDMAWYVYVKYDIPVNVTLAFIAIETNYGRNKAMIKRGDLFGTGKTYKYIDAWDEFGINMEKSYGRHPKHKNKCCKKKKI
jgi:flagellum-specific peptidoglycan hydrolase FlgJ